MGLTPVPSDNDRTLATYEAHARTYLARTSTERRGAPAALLDRLADALPNGRVLEIGSGPGTDADALEERGLVVDRTDAARSFVDLLVAAGRDARVLNVLTDDLGGPYDAVLANAVLLHLARPELELALTRTAGCVRAGGLLAFTLKEGDGAGWSTHKLDAPRHFVYWREDRLREAIDRSPWDLVALSRDRSGETPWLIVLCRLSRRDL